MTARSGANEHEGSRHRSELDGRLRSHVVGRGIGNSAITFPLHANVALLDVLHLRAHPDSVARGDDSLVDRRAPIARRSRASCAPRAVAEDPALGIALEA